MSDTRFEVDAVVFDLDGTLIDSLSVYVGILNAAFERLDLPPISPDNTREAVRDGAFDWDSVLPEGIRDQKAEWVPRCFRIIAEIQPQILRENLRLIAGAADMLRELSKAGLNLGLVTSTLGRYLEDKLTPLRAAGVDRLFRMILTEDELSTRKPSPVSLIECAKRMGLAPGRMVYVGDSRVDIRAGKAAGTRTIGVLTGIDGRAALAAEAPDAILESITALREAIRFPHV